jgi:antitoxin component HigA of HigAB toxin-antitoxin module
MKKLLLAGVATLAITGSTVVVYAQHRPWMNEHARLSPEDRADLADARIAAVHAGLKLTPDQEKMWPPVEAAVRDLVKIRIDRATARMKAREDNAQNQKQPDPIGRLRDRADNMAATAAALKKIADAADPLYKTLDDGQKRRLKMLTHMHHRFAGHEGWRRRAWERGMNRDGDGEQDGGPGSSERL